MTSYEAFKELRENTGISIREFARLTGIAPRTITQYSNGSINLSKIPAIKAYKIFTIFNYPITKFYEEHFMYKEEVEKEIALWRDANKREYDYAILKRRVYSRIVKLKEREKITIIQYEELKEQHKRTFEYLETKQVHGLLNDVLYDEYILPLLFNIRIMSENKSRTCVAQKIVEALYKTDYKIKDISKFCGIADVKCVEYFNGAYNFENMYIITALKLCYVLNLDFEQTFFETIDNKQKNK